MEDDKLLEEKIYIAIPKKDVLPEVNLSTEKDLSYYVGTWITVLLILLGVAVVTDTYTQKQYNRLLIEFRL